MSQVAYDDVLQEIQNFLQQGGTLRSLLDEDVGPSLEILFRYAMQLVDSGETGVAMRILKLLTVYDARSFDYWYQLGRCYQAQQLWVDAVYAFTQAAPLRLTDPRAPCAAGECLLACELNDCAKRAFETAWMLCDPEAGPSELQQRIEAGLARLRGDHE